MSEQRQERGWWLPSLALKRPVTVAVGLCALLVLGAMAYLKIPVKLLPEGLSFPFLLVHINYWNATPREVEEQITKPVEEVLGTLHNLRRMVSKSEPNFARFFIEFEDGTDMDLSYMQVRDRIDRVKSELPEDVEQIYIWKWNPQSEPILFLGVGVPGSENDPRHLVEDHIKKPIERLKGVSMVEVWGAAERMALIEIDPDKARKHRIDPFWLVNKLSQDNFAQTGGTVVEGGTKLLIRSVARYEDIQQVRSLPLLPGIRLGDVAKVSVGYPPEEWISRLNNGPGLALAVYKESGANTVEICKHVKQELDKAFKTDPALAGCKAHFFFDQGEQITESMENLEETAAWGAVFAIAVLFAFLRRVRMTLVITLAIPLSLVASLVVLYFDKDSLNVLTMIGLMLSVGMVVDNSIVVVENIFRRRQLGDSSKRASLRGAGEVALAVLLATLTTLAVFIPLMFLTGSQTLSFYLKAIGLPVCYALVASLLIALLAIPLATNRLGGKAAPFSKLIGGMEKLYERALGAAINKRLDVAIGLALVLVSIIIPYSRTGSTDRMEGNINDIRLIIDLPSNLTFKEKDNILKKYENWLNAKRKTLGIKDIHTLLMPHNPRARIRVFLEPPETRKISRRAIISTLKKTMPKLPGVDARIGWHGRTGTENAVTVKLLGRDSEKLKELADQLVARLRKIPSLTSVEVDADEGAADEVRVVPRRGIVQARGLSPRVLGASVSYALRGMKLKDLRLPERDMPMRVLFAKDEMQSLDDIRDLPMKGAAELVLQALQSAGTSLLETGSGNNNSIANFGRESSTASEVSSAAAAAQAAGMANFSNAFESRAASVWASTYSNWVRQFGDVTKFGPKPGSPSLASDLALDTMADFDISKGFAEIRRENRKTALEIKAYTTKQNLSEVGAEIDRVIAGFSFPRGYKVDKGDRFARMSELFGDIFFSVLLGVVFVYLILAGLFESFILPISVITSVPFAVLGVYWTLYLSGTVFDVMAGVGVVILIGIVVNNAIVLVDLINRLKSEGLERTQAVVQGGRHRLRPILMTALTTIFGLIPMAIGKAQVIGVPYAPLGRAVIGGLLASTLFTLFVVPIAYTYLDDLSKVYSSLLAKFSRGNSKC
ncbi:MAG: efflux RND transporter permease subunit [Deltaproteobacteria bacterium]|nr:efflux RND transporter permease subunit [Deltaproteobacteria bacterium]